MVHEYQATEYNLEKLSQTIEVVVFNAHTCALAIPDRPSVEPYDQDSGHLILGSHLAS